MLEQQERARGSGHRSVAARSMGETPMAREGRRSPRSSVARGVTMAQARISAPALSRRQALWHLGGGLGGIALSAMLGRDRLLAAPVPGVLTRGNIGTGAAAAGPTAPA